MKQPITYIDIEARSPGQLWSLAEASFVLKRSERTLRRMISAGELKCSYLGRSPFILDSEIRRLTGTTVRKSNGSRAKN